MYNDCALNCERCLKKLCARGIPVFAGLEYSQLERIAGLTEHRAYAKGDVVVEENSRPGFVAIVSGGGMKAYKHTPDGREQILYVFSEGDFFGEQSLLFDKPSAYRVAALQPSELCILRKEAFRSLLLDHPDIGMKVIEELGWRLEHLENAVQNMGVRNLEARICTGLLELAGKYGETVPEGVLVHMPLSREGFANYIGIARETASRKLGQLEDGRVIKPAGGRAILICDVHALEAAAGLGVSI